VWAQLRGTCWKIPLNKSQNYTNQYQLKTNTELNWVLRCTDKFVYSVHDHQFSLRIESEMCRVSYGLAASYPAIFLLSYVLDLVQSGSGPHCPEFKTAGYQSMAILLSSFEIENYDLWSLVEGERISLDKGAEISNYRVYYFNNNEFRWDLVVL
jgi:hypothetical protein